MSVLALWLRCLSWSQRGKIMLLFPPLVYQMSCFLYSWYCFSHSFIWLGNAFFISISLQYHVSRPIHFISFSLEEPFRKTTCPIHLLSRKMCGFSCMCQRKRLSSLYILIDMLLCVLVSTELLVCYLNFMQSSIACWCQNYLRWGNELIQTASKQAWEVWNC